MELNGLAEFLEVDSGAQVLATFVSESTLLHGYPAMVRRRIQRGEVVKLAFWPEQNSLSTWLSQWVPLNDPLIGKIAPTGVHLVPRSDRSCFLINTTHQEQTVQLLGNFTDRIAGRSYRDSTNLPPYEVLWLQRVK